MKKKTIIFSCLAVLFLISTPSCFSSGFSTGIICLIICGIFAFFAFRSVKSSSVITHDFAESSDCSPSKPSDDFSYHSPQPDNSSITPSVSFSPSPESIFEFISVKVAGVTFNNDDGESRQTYLSLIRFKRPPFNGSLEILLKEYDFKGSVAYAVFVNNYQIGSVPKSQISYIHENYDRISEIPKINVYGGGHNQAGLDIDFGAEITIKLQK